MCYYQNGVKVKVKCTFVQALRLCTGRRPTGGVEVQLYPFLTRALEMGEGTASRPGRSLPLERPVTHCTGGWVGPRTGVENFAPNGIGSPDLQAVARR